MGHHIESAIPRCVAIEHVQRDDACTWLNISDVNQASGINLHGPAVRVLAQALSTHAAYLANQNTPQSRRDLDIARDLARWMGLDDYAGVQLPHEDDNDGPAIERD